MQAVAVVAKRVVGTVAVLQEYVQRCERELNEALEEINKAQDDGFNTGLKLVRLGLAARTIGDATAELGDARRALQTEVDARAAFGGMS